MALRIAFCATHDHTHTHADLLLPLYMGLALLKTHHVHVTDVRAVFSVSELVVISLCFFAKYGMHSHQLQWHITSFGLVCTATAL